MSAFVFCSDISSGNLASNSRSGDVVNRDDKNVSYLVLQVGVRGR